MQLASELQKVPYAAMYWVHVVTLLKALVSRLGQTAKYAEKLAVTWAASDAQPVSYDEGMLPYADEAADMAELQLSMADWGTVPPEEPPYELG